MLHGILKSSVVFYVLVHSKLLRNSWSFWKCFLTHTSVTFGLEFLHLSDILSLGTLKLQQHALLADQGLDFRALNTKSVQHERR